MRRLSSSKDLTMGIPDQSLVSPEAFSAAMTQRWLNLGNTPSSRLVQVWSIMASTFAAAITFRDRKWRVLQPPTGTGKTQGLCVYAALTITKTSPRRSLSASWS